MSAQVGGGVRLSPSSNYIVQGAASNDLLLFASGSNQGFVFGTSNNSNLLLRIGSNGYVGFGLSNPLFKVDILGDLNFSGTLRQGGVPYVGSQWSNSGSNVFVLGSNVGIGVTAPLAALHVACNLRVDGSVTMFNSISMPAVYFTPGNSANTNTSQIVLATSNIQGYSNLVWGASGSNGTQYSIMSNTSNDVFRWVSGSASNEIMRLTGNGNLGVAGTVSGSNDSFTRNRVVNGDMRIANRGTSVSGSGSVAYAPCDQWVLNYSITTGSITVTQNTLNASDAPYSSGFRYSLKLQATTACTSYGYIQPTQLFDYQSMLGDLNWGLASGVGVSLSFWLRTNLANSSVISASIRNGALAYTYNAPVTITNSGGWQYVTLVLPAPPAGTAWSGGTELMIGARYNSASATAGSWINNNFLGVNGAVDPWATLNNYIEVTGVQLERGSAVTPFEFRAPVVESLLNQNLVLGSVASNTVGNVCAGNLGMFRNRIINGDFRIDQRSSGASHTSSAGSTYIADRWLWESGNFVGASWTIQQYAGAALANGLNNYGGSTVGTTASLPTNGYALMSQRIEGNNIADLAWGSTNAAPITISFWVYTSLAATYAITLRNNGADRGYAVPFTVTTANTWQYVSLCIPGDTTGTWTKDTTTGMYIAISLACGSTYQAAPRTWTAGNILGCTGMTNTWTATASATFYVTGFQVEKGTIATPFEFRPYPIELQLCQRYYQLYPQKTNSTTGYRAPLTLQATSTTNLDAYLRPPVLFRSFPTVTISGAWSVQGGPSLASAPTVTGNTNTGMSAYGDVDNVITVITASSLTVGYMYWLQRAGAATGYIDYNCEL